MTRLTDEQLTEMEARCNAATPGPWETRGNDCPEAIQNVYANCYSVATVRLYPGGDRLLVRTANAEFIAHARSDIPALLAEVRALKAELVGRVEGYDPEERTPMKGERYACQYRWIGTTEISWSVGIGPGFDVPRSWVLRWYLLPGGER